MYNEEDEAANELLGFEQAKDTAPLIVSQQRPCDTTGEFKPSLPKSEHLKKLRTARSNKLRDKKRFHKGVQSMCPMRCCNTEWRDNNSMSAQEAGWFKVLADDLFGLIHALGYLPRDFPSIIHLLSSLSAPGVIEAYKKAGVTTKKELNMRQLCNARVREIRANREIEGNKLQPLSSLDITYKKVPISATCEQKTLTLEIQLPNA